MLAKDINILEYLLQHPMAMASVVVIVGLTAIMTWLSPKDGAGPG